MKVRILPYKSYSKSAKALVEALPNAILKSQYTPVYGRKKVIVNWGNSNPKFNLTDVTVLNQPSAVALASNKLIALNKLKEMTVKVPEFTTDIEVAKQWIEDEKIVLCRTLLRANSGRGIKVAKTIEDLIPAPLYVKYIRKEHEYRVHVFNGQVIDVVEKKRQSGFQDNIFYNKYIRSYEQGWVFTREGLVLTEQVKAEAVKSVQALGLDFGAVDVILNRRNEPVVLEVNTSPGLQGTTLQKYKEAVEQWLTTV